MTWLKIDDGFVEHPKIADLTDRAFRLHMAGLCYSARNLTDGLLTLKATKVVCALTGGTRRHLVELRDASLWQQLEDAWLIRDYLDYNPSAAEIKERRAIRSAAGRAGGIASGEARREAKGEASASANRSSKGGSTPGPSQTPTRKPNRPVPDIESVGAALALLETIPDAYRDAGTRKVILAYVDEGLPAEAFHEVKAELAGRDDIRNPAKYANGALKKRAQTRHLVA